MRKGKLGETWLVAILGCLAVAGACYHVSEHPGSPCRMETQTGYVYPLPHGGTTPPNAEPYSAMFFKEHGVNPFVDTDEDEFSTFAVDVDTASYTIARRYISDGYLPPKEAVRVEEFVNYFKYDYAAPADKAFAVYLDGAPARFATEKHKMLRIGIKGKEIEAKDRKPATLTFVIDVSGSMGIENRLGLVKKALRYLVDQMREQDSIGIVVYGTNARVVMQPSSAADSGRILSAIDELHAEGSTNAEEGLLVGYRLADQVFRDGAINRVVLCSDGVANVGTTDADGILAKIKNYAQKGICLTAVGFGMGNYNDVLMERLADKGDGNYAYVDTEAEARRIFAENLTGTMQIIARNAKVQVEFNPAVVRSYRLLGYENRDIKDADFRKDDVDGGEIGAGHSVTALYEMKLHENPQGDKVATVCVRYEDPETKSVQETTAQACMTDFQTPFERKGADFRLAAVVAEFAEILRESYWAKESELSQVLTLARAVAEELRGRQDVKELADLISKAKDLMEKKGSKSVAGGE